MKTCPLDSKTIECSYSVVHIKRKDGECSIKSLACRLYHLPVVASSRRIMQDTISSKETYVASKLSSLVQA